MKTEKERQLTEGRRLGGGGLDGGGGAKSNDHKKYSILSYIRTFRGTNDPLIYGENISAFPHILGSPS
jgi:hypothetical protein